MSEDPLARVLARRERHRRRPLLVRVLAGAAGTVLFVVGAAFVLPLPEAGLPLLLAGIGLLALEFDWAVRAHERVLRLAARLRALPRWARAAAAAGFVALGVGLFLWLH